MLNVLQDKKRQFLAYIIFPVSFLSFAYVEELNQLKKMLWLNWESQYGVCKKCMEKYLSEYIYGSAHFKVWTDLKIAMASDDLHLVTDAYRHPCRHHSYN